MIKLITIIINKTILMFLILKKISKNRKKLLELEIELTKLNDLQKNNIKYIYININQNKLLIILK